MIHRITKLAISCLAFFVVLNLVHPGAAIPVVPRDTNTCADPSLAEVFKQGYSPSFKAYGLGITTAFVRAIISGGDWQIHNDVFSAWATPQEFTSPVYVLFNPTSLDYTYILSADGTVPSAAGFGSPVIIGYIYATQVCGSVPLFQLFHDVIGSHWHTTRTDERAELLASGWLDSGVVGFVLPLSSW